MPKSTQLTQSDQELDPGLPVCKPGQVAPVWVHDELGDYFSEPQVAYTTWGPPAQRTPSHPGLDLSPPTHPE